MLCIISSGTENFNLVKLCQEQNIPCTLFVDTLFRPYQDKDTEFLIQRTQHIMEYMTKQGATHFILSPAIELSLLQSPFTIHNSQFTILSLFTNYLTHCLQHSLVGKIGFVGGYSDISQIESLFENITNSYISTDNQKNIKKFHNPLCKWTKDTSMREYFARLFSPRQLLINKTIKQDLRHFKDANVDTIIPLNYSYFNYQRVITGFFNQKKQKFHKREIIESIFKEMITKEEKLLTSNSQLLTIYYTGSLHLIQHKKWEALLSQGGQRKIEYKKIDF